ncbi:MAG TPA: potassium/proton antiporter [Flavitalea sp.]|nr:potassium/proton antiporter [Flavitalea sp.]
MEFNLDHMLLIGSILLLVSIIAGKTSDRFGVPTLIIFLIIGILAGSEGIGGIHFDNPRIAQFIGVVALNFILFSGGLDTNWQSTRPILWRGIALSTIGVFVTATAVGVFAHTVADFSLLEGLLLGAIVSSTDAAAVFSILRTRSIGLKGNLRPTLELESGSNDPMAYFLTISLTSLLVNNDVSGWTLLISFFKEFLIGTAMGVFMGNISHWIINHIKLKADGLYPVLLLGLAMFTFSATHFIGGNGFLAIYLCGVILGNKDFIHKKSLIRFYDGQAWLMQIILFLTLGLLVFPSKILPVIVMGLLLSAFLIFIARPIGVFLSLSFFKMNVRNKVFISWVGLRGSVPIVFATYPLIAGVDKSPLIFNLVFFISVSSVLLQGTTLPLVAKWLHVIVPTAAKRRFGFDIEMNESLKSKLKEVDMPHRGFPVGRQIVDLRFPKTAHIMTIKRGEKYLTPNGSTFIEPNDRLYILAEDEGSFNAVFKSLKIQL